MPKRINIGSVEELGRITANQPSDPIVMQQVIERFPVRVTPHLQMLMDRSPAVAVQFLPDEREITTLGQTHCFQGLLHTGIDNVERMYPDRCIIMPQPACPAYCRFCFRKFYEHGSGSAMSHEDLRRALDYVGREKDLREVLITGGEPVMDRKRLRILLEGLRRIDHIDVIRIGCRSLILEPSLIDQGLIELLVAHQDLRNGKPLEVALHCNHPAEIADVTVEKLAALRNAGIHVYNQAVLLRGINTEPQVMIALLRLLRRYGVESYHLYFGGPVQGMDHMRPTLSQAIALKSAIRAEGTGRLNPHLIVTTRLGKVELGVDGWIVEREADNRHVWIRTPYRRETFRRVDPNFELPEDARIDDTGHIVVRYLDGPDLTAAEENA